MSGNGNHTISPELDDHKSLILARIENLRPKLLDLSRRNPLISTRLSSRSNVYIRAVDELPDVLFFGLSQQDRFRFSPLPPLEEDPKDEETEAFQSALAEARLTDEEYAEALENINPADENALVLQRKAERAMGDRVRENLGMAPRQTREDLSLARHARNNGISPSYELPCNEEEHVDGRHTDDAIQTLLLPNDLERTANRLITKCRSWQLETGLNVMNAAFGFLEWEDGAGKDRSFSPLVLVPVEIKKTKTRGGPVFWIEGTGEPGETNNVLAEKLRLELGIELPPYGGGSIEDYMTEVAEAAPSKITWRVRRYATFGVFPSARLAMYYDLDTQRPEFSTNGIVDELLGGKAPDPSASPFADEYEVDHPEIESKVPLLVTDADSSQFSTMVDVANAKNLAVEGPPGTGKSQTIVNTIAAALAEGKKVLFVAEKMAALDVVRSRLNHLKFGEFILPLQANRSSREQVINSIRERIQIDRIAAPPNYKAQIAKFRKTRDEIAHYIELISREYRDTGFTVHEILGRSILTSSYLDGLPRSFQTPHIEAFGREWIEEIKTTAKAVEEAWRKAEAAPEYWRDIQIDALDRFTADDMLNRAADAAVLYDKVDAVRGMLAPFGVPDEAGVEAIKRLQLALTALSNLQSPIEPCLVDALVRDGRVRGLKNMLSDCGLYREQRDSLSVAFEPPFDQILAGQLQEMQKICEKSGFDTLDIVVLKERRKALDAFICKGEDVERDLAAFLEEVPELADYPIKALTSARRSVNATPSEALLLRNETTADSNTAPFIKRGIKTGAELKKEREELASIFALESMPAVDEISHRVAVLRSAGPFSFLSPEYREAKRFYRMLYKGRGFRKDQAANELARLAKWKNEEERFLADQQLQTVFGIHFNGIDTDFGCFEQLLGFYDLVDRELSGLASRDIRKFLKTAELDLLRSIPTIDFDDLEMTHGELGEKLGRCRAERERMGDGIEPLKEPACRIKDTGRVRPDTLPEFADLVAAHATRRATIEGHPLLPLLGDRFASVETKAQVFAGDLAAADILLEHADWTEVLCALLGEGRVREAVTAIEAFFVALNVAEVAVDALGEKTMIEREAFLPDAAFTEIVRYLVAASEDREGLNIHAAYLLACREIEREGMGRWVFDLLNGGHGLENLPVILEALIIRALSIKVYGEYGATLGRYTGEKLDALRKSLAALDKQIIGASRKYLRAKLIHEAQPPGGNGRGKKSTWTELALLNNEINKRRGYYPVRDLTRRAGRALLELKPCWMMSPLSIAQYLEPGTVEFDLCIIDEASQMPPENAIGTLLRAKQVMIVGDTNQLPPTSFFRKMIVDDDADEDETIVEESILEMANATFRPPRQLRWHYRSRHSGLIRFSNRVVYKDDLVVFPSPSENREDMGVSFVKVEGSYKGGANAAEAKVMVEAAIRFMCEQPHRSFGIATLNQKQRDLIAEEMNYAMNHDSRAEKYVDYWASHNDGLERFFIKNLENVQGDERDVIFIGTVYGPEKLGAKVQQRFGPINGVAGKRRLNVLFSRAKEQIVTFSSMTAGDITADETGNAGAHMLKRWLEFAATGVLDAGETTDREPDSDFEEFVAQQIRAMGCEPVHQVGVAGYFIDLGVRHPDWPHGFLLGVECDGATYHASKSARDRDRLRQEVLEGLGWHFHRIWSTDWFNDPRTEAEKLRRRIEKRLVEEKTKGPVTVVPAIDDEAVEHRPTGDHIEFDEEETDGRRDIFSHVALEHTASARDNVRAAKRALDSTEIDVGDMVRVHYLTGDPATLLVTLSDTKNDPDNGIVHINQPLGKALLGAEADDEVEVLVGSRVRLAKIEEVRKPQIA